MIDAKTLAGKDGLYPDDIAEILANADPEKRAVLMRIGRAVVDHYRYDQAMKWLDDLYREHGTAREGRAGLFYGQPGVGKSTILKRFASMRAGPFETAKGTVRPVVLVEVPSNPNEINLFDALLTALGCEHLCVGKAEERKRAVVEQVKAQHVHMIILDEFTHVIEDKTEKFQKKAVRHLKSMLSEGACQFVFAGTEELTSIHEVYGQIRRRDAGDFYLTPFNWADEADRDEWCAILASIAGEALEGEKEEDVEEGILAIPPSPPISGLKQAHKLHKATGGNISSLMKLLFRATAIAYDEGDEALVDGVFAEAFEFARRGSKDDNPFGLPRRKPRKPRLSELPEGFENELTGVRKGERRDRDSFSKR
ncbi:TniB family NTP-binding protein [Methylobacterium aerolatum]|uniref:Adenylate kinase family enzyme n=1 Tax=Methylobacterium aerolatum TaxID=418708 RepID=A0ABU0HVL0_9HYPH|nr:TniB family NTP-binding protein [Methylobacterium aerolatum]MDQ0446372.1 adenylate kinase family enzyme [Methylobacterium aerolatum]GJD33465.1 hypothetical protein FMGBMHLM_0352 [Methylobacterium aerolatum]